MHWLLWLAACGSSDPERALRGVGGEVVRDESLPGKPIVEVELTNPYAPFPPWAVLAYYVSDEHLAPLAGLTSLRRLAIRSDRITDAGLVHLSGLASLEDLDLEAEHLTGAGL